MANRILLGNTGSYYGLKISKPGYDVLTTSDENLMLDTNSLWSRVMQMGLLTFASGGITTQTASLPTLSGGAPIVMFKYSETSAGQTYLFPVWRNESNISSNTSNASNGWTCQAYGGTVSVTRNYSSSVTNYIYYFALVAEI